MIKGFDREIIFKNKNKIKCCNCKTMVTWKTGYYGYNLIFCEKRWKEFKKNAEKEALKVAKWIIEE